MVDPNERQVKLKNCSYYLTYHEAEILIQKRKLFNYSYDMIF